MEKSLFWFYSSSRKSSCPVKVVHHILQFDPQGLQTRDISNKQILTHNSVSLSNHVYYFLIVLY